MALSAALQEAFTQAVAAHRRGDGARAEAVYRAVLDADPDHAEARHLMGVLALQRGAFDEARAQIDHALRVAPGVAKYHNTLANLFFALDRPVDAAAALRRALEIDPDLLDARFNLGTVLQGLGRLEEAEAAFRAVLAQVPDHAKAHNNLGTVLKARGETKQAFEHYEQAERLAPDLAEAVQNVGVSLKQQGRPEEARARFARLLTIRPSDAARLNMVTCLPGLIRDGADISVLRARLRDDLADLASRPLHLDDPNEEVASLGHFFLAYHGLDDRPLNEALAKLFRRAAPSLSFVAPHCRDRRAWRPGKRIRVGIISAYLRNHTVGTLMKDLFALFPRDRLEVIAIGPDGETEETRTIRVAAEAYVVLPGKLAKARATIAELALDVLFYADIGMEPLTYFLAFSRLAPVQCVTWGHPVTSGIDGIDHFLSAEHLETPEADADYTEKLIRLRFPPTALSRPEAYAPLDRARFGLSEGAHLYICPQTLFKLHPDFDAVFARILAADPRGEIVLIKGQPHWRAVLEERFSRLMPPEAVRRVRWLDRLSVPEFHNLLRLGDVMLDPLHFSGGLTSMQGFSAGTPIVTLPARYMRGRVTTAYWRKMGLDDGIAADLDDYVNKAVAWGTDKAARAEVSAKIGQASGALFGDVRVAEDMTAYFIGAVETARSA